MANEREHLSTGLPVACSIHTEDHEAWCHPCLLAALDVAESTATRLAHKVLELRAARETVELLLARARPHVYRQQHRGAHEQDRSDATELLRAIKAAGQ